MSDTPTPRIDALCQKLAMRPDGTYLDRLNPSAFWTMANLAKEMEADLAAKDRLLESMAGACKAINDAHGSMFAQCCSNPIFNTWGKEVDVSTLNEAHQLAESALKEYADTTPIPLDPAPAPQ